jgi:hypothetical protein
VAVGPPPRRPALLTPYSRPAANSISPSAPKSGMPARCVHRGRAGRSRTWPPSHLSSPTCASSAATSECPGLTR